MAMAVFNPGFDMTFVRLRERHDERHWWKTAHDVWRLKPIIEMGISTRFVLNFM
jgi:hypothetical protein